MADEHIFITHDPQWEDVQDVKDLLDILERKRIWYRPGKWSGKIVQNISHAVENNTVLSLNSVGNPHDQIFRNKVRKMGMVIVFTSYTPGPEDRPSWCSGVITNTIKCGMALLTRNPIEKGWVFSWGLRGDRQEKIFKTLDELKEFFIDVEEYGKFGKRMDWVNDELELNLFDDKEAEYLDILKTLTDEEFAEKLQITKDKMRKATQEEEAKKKDRSAKIFDPQMHRLRSHQWKKDRNVENNTLFEKIEAEEEEEVKPRKKITRKFGKTKITV